MLGPDLDRTPGLELKKELPKEEFKCDLTLRQIQRELRKLTKLAKEGQSVDEARFDYLLKAQEHNEEYQRILAEERENWRESVEEFADQCLQRTRTFIPVNIFESSEESLRELGLTTDLIKRILQRQCLWLVRMSKEEISRTHESDLLGRFNSLAQGMDIIETAAIYASLPDSFSNDYTNRKHDWKNNIEENLRQLLLDNDNDELPEERIRNPAYEGLQFGPVEDTESVRPFEVISGRDSHLPRRSFIELCQQNSIVSKLKDGSEAGDDDDSSDDDESDEEYDDSEVHEGESVVVVEDTLSDLGTPFKSKNRSSEGSHKASPHVNRLNQSGSASAESSFAIMEGEEGEEEEDSSDDDAEEGGEKSENEDDDASEDGSDDDAETTEEADRVDDENDVNHDFVSNDVEPSHEAEVVDAIEESNIKSEDSKMDEVADGDDDDSEGEDWDDIGAIHGRRGSASSDWTEDRVDDNAEEVEAADVSIVIDSTEEGGEESAASAMASMSIEESGESFDAGDNVTENQIASQKEEQNPIDLEVNFENPGVMQVDKESALQEDAVQPVEPVGIQTAVSTEMQL